MEKIKLTREALENNTFEFKTCSFIPYVKKEEMAERLVLSTMIYNDGG